MNRWYCTACKAWCHELDTDHYLWCPGRIFAVKED